MLQETKGVFGACLTGSGFGGACVTLVAAGKAEAIAQDVLGQYKRARDSDSAALDRLPTATVLHVTA